MENPNNNTKVAIACLAAASLMSELNLTDEQLGKLEAIYNRISSSNFVNNTLNNEALVNATIEVFEEYLQGEGL